MDRRFPIGPFTAQPSYTPEELQALITIIAESPSRYREVAATLSPDDLTKTYREGSWTIRQLIHHVADIQFLHLLRMKKALTEPDYTTVTLIDMNAWAHMPDSTMAPIEDSLRLLDGVTPRYVYLAKSLDDAQLAIQYYHPLREYWINQTQALAMSAWHVQHHLAHIKLALGDF